MNKLLLAGVSVFLVAGLICKTEERKLLVSLVLIVVGMLAHSYSIAQYVSAADEVIAERRAQEEKRAAFYSYPIGKTFWIEPNKDVLPLFRKVFYRSMEMKKIGSYPNILTFSDGFYPTSITSFVPLKYFDYGITSFYTDGPSRQHAYLERLTK